MRAIKPYIVPVVKSFFEESSVSELDCSGSGVCCFKKSWQCLAIQVPLLSRAGALKVIKTAQDAALLPRENS